MNRNHQTYLLLIGFLTVSLLFNFYLARENLDLTRENIKLMVENMELMLKNLELMGMLKEDIQI